MFRFEKRKVYIDVETYCFTGDQVWKNYLNVLIVHRQTQFGGAIEN